MLAVPSRVGLGGSWVRGKLLDRVVMGMVVRRRQIHGNGDGFTVTGSAATLGRVREPWWSFVCWKPWWRIFAGYRKVMAAAPLRQWRQRGRGRASEYKGEGESMRMASASAPPCVGAHGRTWRVRPRPTRAWLQRRQARAASAGSVSP